MKIGLIKFSIVITFYENGSSISFSDIPKTIQSKLSKKQGVTKANLIFTDSIATIEFDPNKTSTEDLTSFINGIAGGELYKASKIAAIK